MQRRTLTSLDVFFIAGLVLSLITLGMLYGEKSGALSRGKPSSGIEQFADQNGKHDRPALGESRLIAVGSFPALAIYLPITTIWNDPPSDLAVAIGLRVVGSVMAILLVSAVCGFYWPLSPWFVRFGVMFSIVWTGIGNLLVLNHGPWPIALLWSQACFIAAIYCSFRSQEEEKAATSALAMTSLLFGLAAGGLKTFALLTPCALLPLFIRSKNGFSIRKQEIAASVLPVMCCIGLVIWSGYQPGSEAGPITSITNSFLDLLGKAPGILSAAASPALWGSAYTYSERYLFAWPALSSTSFSLAVSVVRLHIFSAQAGLIFLAPIVTMPLIAGAVFVTRRYVTTRPSEIELRFPRSVSIPLLACACVNLTALSLQRQTPWWGLGLIDLPLITLGSLSWLFARIVVSQQAGWAAIINTSGILLVGWGAVAGLLAAWP